MSKWRRVAGEVPANKADGDDGVGTCDPARVDDDGVDELESSDTIMFNAGVLSCCGGVVLERV